MNLPSDISVKPSAIEMPKTEYNFPSQIRESEIPLEAGYYTFGTIATYDWNGNPTDSRGDNWD
ncbi:hypothetical protein OAY05_03605 [Gammaproteobacteria bacterium]|nr:hypothetical protein [Gammaproteobacteria bacterium]